MDRDKLFNISECAEYLHANPVTVRDLLKTGKLKGYKTGNKWLVPGFSLIEYVQDRIEETQREIEESGGVLKGKPRPDLQKENRMNFVDDGNKTDQDNEAE